MSTDHIVLKYEDGVRTIILNRPQKKNAISAEMYKTILNVLTEDAGDDKVVVTILTANGAYFSSGTEITLPTDQDLPKSDINVVKSMIDAFINYPKLLIAVINGPAIGIGATMAALCDVIYATDRAVFDTPFLNLGLCAEAGSSFTFPFTLGRSKASEVLLLNQKLSAQEAHRFGLISNVIPHFALEQFVSSLKKYGKLPVNSVKVNKELIMANLRPILCECNEREAAQLQKCVQSDEFSEALLKFFSKNSKL